MMQAKKVGEDMAELQGESGVETGGGAIGRDAVNRTRVSAGLLEGLTKTDMLRASCRQPRVPAVHGQDQGEGLLPGSRGGLQGYVRRTEKGAGPVEGPSRSLPRVDV